MNFLTPTADDPPTGAASYPDEYRRFCEANDAETWTAAAELDAARAAIEDGDFDAFRREWTDAPEEQPTLFPTPPAFALLRQCGGREMHPRPLVRSCSGGSQHYHRVLASEAVRFEIVEYLRTPNTVTAIALDCDSGNAREIHERIRAGKFPPYNLLVESGTPGRFHLLYVLRVPVHYGESERVRLKPLETLRRIEEFLVQDANADPRFNGVTARNPDFRGARTILLSRRPYNLLGNDPAYALSPFFTGRKLPRRRPVLNSTGGRNADMLSALNAISGQPQNWHAPPEAIYDAAETMNRELAEQGRLPLSPNELAGIVRSVLRFRRRRGFGSAADLHRFNERQSRRGKRSAAKRADELSPDELTAYAAALGNRSAALRAERYGAAGALIYAALGRASAAARTDAYDYSGRGATGGRASAAARTDAYDYAGRGRASGTARRRRKSGRNERILAAFADGVTQAEIAAAETALGEPITQSGVSRIISRYFKGSATQ